MNLEQLLRRFRVLAEDRVEPYLFSGEDVADWLSDAEAQAAVRARLLLESALPAVCEVPVFPGQHTYNLHAKLYEIEHLRLRQGGDTRSVPLRLVSRQWLDDSVRDWRDQLGEVRYAVQGETSLRLVGVPDEAGVLLIEGYRLPLKPLANHNDKPEIHEASHEMLIHWALHRAFSIPDTETFDPDRAALAERKFTAYFGPMPDADMRRLTREDQVQHNTSYPP